MRTTMILTMTAMTFAGAVEAADPTEGEGDFKRCRGCHAITAEDGTDIQKGGKTGPNLYGVVGRAVGSLDGFSYGPALAAAGEEGIVWDESKLAAYVEDPNTWLQEVLGDPNAKSKMTFKLKKGSEDMAAYLASVGGDG